MAHWTKSIHSNSRGYAAEMDRRHRMHVLVGRRNRHDDGVPPVAAPPADAASQEDGGGSWPAVLVGVGASAIGAAVVALVSLSRKERK